MKAIITFNEKDFSGINSKDGRASIKKGLERIIRLKLSLVEVDKVEVVFDEDEKTTKKLPKTTKSVEKKKKK